MSGGEGKDRRRGSGRLRAAAGAEGGIENLRVWAVGRPNRGGTLPPTFDLDQMALDAATGARLLPGTRRIAGGVRAAHQSGQFQTA